MFFLSICSRAPSRYHLDCRLAASERPRSLLGYAATGCAAAPRSRTNNQQPRAVALSIVLVCVSHLRPINWRAFVIPDSNDKCVIEVHRTVVLLFHGEPSIRMQQSACTLLMEQLVGKVDAIPFILSICRRSFLHNFSFSKQSTSITASVDVAPHFSWHTIPYYQHLPFYLS